MNLHIIVPVLNPRCPTVVEINEGGAVTAWSYTVWGPVGTTGTLKDGTSHRPAKNKVEREACSRVERLFARALTSQNALALSLGIRTGIPA